MSWKPKELLILLIPMQTILLVIFWLLPSSVSASDLFVSFWILSSFLSSKRIFILNIPGIAVDGQFFSDTLSFSEKLQKSTSAFSEMCSTGYRTLAFVLMRPSPLLVVCLKGPTVSSPVAVNLFILYPVSLMVSIFKISTGNFF